MFSKYRNLVNTNIKHKQYKGLLLLTRTTYERYFVVVLSAKSKWSLEVRTDQRRYNHTTTTNMA